jgi:hypothetical protein
MRVQLLSNAVANGSGTIVTPLPRGVRHRPVGQGVCQISGITTATVTLQGRGDSSSPWVTVNTVTTDGASAVQLMYQMQATITGYTAGTINVWLNI